MTCSRDCIVHKWFDNDGDDECDVDDSDDDGEVGGIDDNDNGDDDDVDDGDDDYDNNGDNDDDGGDDDELVNWCFEPSQPARDYIRDEKKVMMMMMMTTTRMMITRTRKHSLTSVIVSLVDCIRVSLVYNESVLLSGNS